MCLEKIWLHDTRATRADASGRSRQHNFYFSPILDKKNISARRAEAMPHLTRGGSRAQMLHTQAHLWLQRRRLSAPPAATAEAFRTARPSTRLLPSQRAAAATVGRPSADPRARFRMEGNERLAPDWKQVASTIAALGFGMHRFHQKAMVIHDEAGNTQTAPCGAMQICHTSGE